MFTSFDEKNFKEAIKNKDLLTLKINTVSAILNDPTFERGETDKVIRILEEQIPEIFENEVTLDFEERLEKENWDKRYFSKLTYWLQENFAKTRIEYIKEVGRVVHKDTAEKYNQSMEIQGTNNSVTNTHKKKAKKKPKIRNFIIAGTIVAVIVLAMILIFKALQ